MLARSEGGGYESLNYSPKTVKHISYTILSGFKMLARSEGGRYESLNYSPKTVKHVS